MYAQIEYEFKKNSKTHNSRVLFGLLVLLYIFVTLIIIINAEDHEFFELIYVVCVISEAILFCIACYVFMYFMGVDKSERSLKSFFKIGYTLQEYQDKIHNNDIELLKVILEEYNINTRPKVEEAIRHYQCLLPRKVVQPGQLISILAFVISMIALFLNEIIIKSKENISFIVLILLTTTALYALVRFVGNNVIRVFGKDAFYARIEDSLSEIFMSYYLKKKE